MAGVSGNWRALKKKLGDGKGGEGNRRERDAPKVSENGGGGNDEFEDGTRLQPVGSSKGITETLALDCEMVGVGKGGRRSALARATLINSDGHVIYDEYVRPKEKVVDYRTEVSGIRGAHMRDAVTFEEAHSRVAELVKGRIIVGHGLENDFKVLLLSHAMKDTRDSACYPPFTKARGARQLKQLAKEQLGISIQNGTHDPVEDARASLLLYQKNKDSWDKWIQNNHKTAKQWLTKNRRRLKRKKPGKASH